MSNQQRLELKQAQSLVMTPQLQQSIKLLQLSSLELSAFITQELEKNPLLVREDAAEDEFSVSNEDNDNKATPEPQQDAADTLSDPARDETFEDNYKEAWEGGDNPSTYLTYSNAKNDNQGSGYAFEEMQTAPLTLKQHITDQINVEISDVKERLIALHLTDLLDDNGYITSDFSSLAETLECDNATIENVLHKLQALDPLGVFARSVAECLSLQLKDTDRLTPDMDILLKNLGLLANGELKQLQKLCGVDEDELKELIKEIKLLNPKPGTNFSTDVVQVVQADVYLRKDTKGNWVVTLNNDVLPKLLINKRYVEEIGKKAHKKEDKKYLSEQASAANWLIKILDQRAQTILKVATEIVTQQQEFFNRGIRYLKPLTLSSVADAIGMHESTVSRVTTHKYMATPIGMYELKYFFSSSLHGSDGGGEYSSKSVKFLIQELITNETSDNVLSDESIAEILQKRGIDIARRTVAKYREEVGLPTSSKRKREKRLK